MKTTKIQRLLLLTLISLIPFQYFSQTTQEDFTDGYYKLKMNRAVQKVYVDINETGVLSYSVDFTSGTEMIDTTTKKLFPLEAVSVITERPIFRKNSSDFDFMTIPLKLRPAQADVPTQLNTHLNGALYAGYRNDRYGVRYSVDPLLRSQQIVNHFGVSIGFFSGIGGTFISPTTTNFMLDQEYDGVVWCNGIAAFIGINRFTIGLAAGIDHLTDSNRSIWIYQDKPWLGLAFGVNLN